MNILLTGASGQLGRELAPLLASLGTVVGVDRDDRPGDDSTVQQYLGEPRGVSVLLDRVNPDIVVNAAAYTAVDAAEDDPDTAFRLNAELPGWLAEWCAHRGAWLVHYSTDYVFAGDSSRPYREDDPTGALNVYGQSKQAGESAVSGSGCRYLLLRTSWVYSAHGHNFMLSMLRLAAERDRLRIVDDQLGCPTFARNLAAASLRLLERVLPQASDQLAGLYHYCDRDAVSWFGFAGAVLETAMAKGLLDRLPELEAIGSDEFPQRARRPRYSVLDAGLIERTFGIERAPLLASLESCLEEVKRASSQAP